MSQCRIAGNYSTVCRIAGNYGTVCRGAGGDIMSNHVTLPLYSHTQRECKGRGSSAGSQGPAGRTFTVEMLSRRMLCVLGATISNSLLCYVVITYFICSGSAHTVCNLCDPGATLIGNWPLCYIVTSYFIYSRGAIAFFVCSKCYS